MVTLVIIHTNSQNRQYWSMDCVASKRDTILFQNLIRVGNAAQLRRAMFGAWPWRTMLMMLKLARRLYLYLASWTETEIIMLKEISQAQKGGPHPDHMKNVEF